MQIMDQTQPQSSGSLKISLKLSGKRRDPQASVKKQCPFYCMKESLPPPNQILGSKDLISFVDLGTAYQKYCTPGKLKQDLASFLPQLCHTANMCSSISSSTSLKTLIEKPPITGKNIIVPDMKGFQLQPGTVTEAYQLFDTKDAYRLIGNAPHMGSREANELKYDEFGVNFNDHENTKKAHRSKIKRSLEEIAFVEERKIKKHKREKKKDKKKKKDKDRDRNEEKDREASFY